MSGQFPSSPNFRHLKNEAKRLLKQWIAGETVALQELRLLHPSFELLSSEQLGTKMCLHNAQLALARRYGFQNWQDLSARVATTTQVDLSALSTEQVAFLLTAPNDSVPINTGGIAAIQADRLAKYERGRPRREDGRIILSEKLGLTLEEALNDRAKLHHMPPVGTRYTNGHGSEWMVASYAFFVAPTTLARYPGDCDYLPVVEPLNMSPRLSCLVAEVDRCTSKWVLFLDTMPHTHPFGLGRNLHCAHISADPTEAHIFLDVKNAHETTIAHELAHLWIWFVEGMDGERALRDRKDHARKNQLDFIQSFVLDIRVNDLIEKRGFDMLLISKDQIDGLEALRKLIMTGFTPPTRREMLLYCLQVAAVILEQKRWPGEMQERLPKLLEFFEAAVPEIYKTATEFVDIITRRNVDSRDGLRAALEECTVLGFRFTQDDFDLDRDLEEVTPTECMQDKYPHELAEYPVPLKLEICRARARHGIRGDGTVTVTTSPSGMAMLILRGKDGTMVGPIQVNYRMGPPEWLSDASRERALGVQRRAIGGAVKVDPQTQCRHIPIMERQRIKGMIPGDYGRLPGDNGYNTSYPPGLNPFTQMQRMNDGMQQYGASGVHGQVVGQWQNNIPGADQYGRLPGNPDYMMPFPPGHPAFTHSYNSATRNHTEAAPVAPQVFPWLNTTRRYMAGLALSVAQTRLAQQMAMMSTNLYQYAENNPVNLADPSGEYPCIWQRVPPGGTITAKACRARCDSIYKSNAKRQACYFVCKQLKNATCTGLLSLCSHFQRQGQRGLKYYEACTDLYADFCENSDEYVDVACSCRNPALAPMAQSGL